jgi:hypothetical protein
MSSRSRLQIATARTLHGVTTGAEYHRWLIALGSVKQRMRQMSVRPEQVGQPEAPDTNAPPALAYVNHGRWVADCPTAFCAGAVPLLPGAPFMCGNCLNAECGFKYRPVEWPADRAHIEEVLGERLLPETANWRPGETAERLTAENAAYMGGVR